MSTIKVSFIIPTLNRERTLEACLKSISNQIYPNKEIIIVDGGSRDGTLTIASKYATKIILDKGSLGQARQRSVEESSGEILGVFDSDIVLPTKDWTDRAVKKLLSGKNVGVVWPINKTPANSSIITRCYLLLWQAKSKDFLTQKGKKWLVPGGNALILRKALQAAGGFNRTLKFGEDLELGRQIRKLGYEVVVFEEPIIHDTMWSLKEYTRKQIWGASSLATADMSIVDLCLNWSDDKVDEKKSSFLRSAMSSIAKSLGEMARGLARDRDAAWLVLPLLLSIRIIIYARYFSVRMIKKTNSGT